LLALFKEEATGCGWLLEKKKETGFRKKDHGGNAHKGLENAERVKHVRGEIRLTPKNKN